MASTTAMLTGLTGLNANARNLDVIGNNIANVNTTAFKSNRMLFASQFSRNISMGSAPSTTQGGTNPTQIGLGVTIAGTQRNFNTGSIAATGDSRDLAIEGNGFFIVQRGSENLYTRAGGFRQNSANDLVTISGERVMGYGVDTNYNVVQTSLVPVNLPVGEMRLCEATQNIRFTGNLNAGGALPSRGSRTTTNAFLSTAAGNPPITAASLMTELDDPAAAGFSSLFAVGDVVQLTGAEKGGRTLPNASFTITATTTVADYMAFLTEAMGIQTSIGPNPDGLNPGVTVDGTGAFDIIGNFGTANDLLVQSGDLKHTNSSGAVVGTGTPFTTNKSATADGESIRTSTVAYDSLGNAVNVDLTMALQSKDASGTTWRYFIESADDTDIDLRVGTGTTTFDSNGQPTSTAPISASIDRSGVGSATPLTLSIDLSSPTSTVTALASTRSELAATYQDGTPMGTLASFSVGQNGVITGAFTNGLTRTVGQIALANFANPEGLVDVGSSLFAAGPNSGNAVQTTPTSLGTGRIVGGSLEGSNVDLAEEFIKLIQASTGYSASSRIISTTDQLLQQLLVLGR